MDVVINPRCPGCASEVEELLQLNDLIVAKKVAMRFHIVFNGDHDKGDESIGQGSATIMLAAGFMGQDQLMETITSMMRKHTEIRTVDDALLALPPSVPSDYILKIISEKQDELAQLLTGAKNLQRARGITSTPALWISRRDEQNPIREFVAKAPAAMLRTAIESLAFSDAQTK